MQSLASYSRKLLKQTGARDFMRADEHFKASRFDEAVACYKKYLKRNPGSVIGWLNLGHVYMTGHNDPLAIDAFSRCLCSRENESGLKAAAMNNMGIIMRRMKRLQEWVFLWTKAFQESPGNPCIMRNYGTLMRFIGDYKAARHCFETLKTQVNSVDDHYGLFAVDMVEGKWLECWPHYEWRFKQTGFPSKYLTTTKPQWHGEPIPGKTLFIWDEQGFGDSLMLFRYAQQIAASETCTTGGTKVILRCQPQLETLFKRKETEALTIVSGDTIPNHDVHCPTFSLPGIFKETPDTAMRWPGSLLSESTGDPRKIGLCWAGSPSHGDDQFRSIDIKYFQPIVEVGKQCGLQFVSLQPPGHAVDMGGFESLTTKTFAETYDHIVSQRIGLVISVDTSMAHLAANMGLPTWMLVPACPDPRWMIPGVKFGNNKNQMDSETHTPWYPTMKLYRARDTVKVIKENGAQWEEPIKQIANDLKALEKQAT